MIENKCNFYQLCQNGDEVGISLSKCLSCKTASNFSSKEKHKKPVPKDFVKKDSISLTDILWRELKESFFSKRDLFSLSDYTELWQEYQIKLIKESQG